MPDTQLIPDSITPVIAWRGWNFRSSCLRSLNGDVWPTGTFNSAFCKRWLVHTSPEEKCTCGIYCCNTYPDFLERIGWDISNIAGEVKVWGKLVVHERGYRAQYARPQNFYLFTGKLPSLLSDVQCWLNYLTRFGVDIWLLNHPLKLESALLLWDKETERYESGMDYLAKSAAAWYTYKPEVPTLRVGDSVAVLGRGIALVTRFAFLNGYEVVELSEGINHFTSRLEDIVWVPSLNQYEVKAKGFFSRGKKR